MLAMTEGWHLASVQFPRHGVIADKASRSDVLDHSRQCSGAHVGGMLVGQAVEKRGCVNRRRAATGSQGETRQSRRGGTKAAERAKRLSPIVSLVPHQSHWVTTHRHLTWRLLRCFKWNTCNHGKSPIRPRLGAQSHATQSDLLGLREQCVQAAGRRPRSTHASVRLSCDGWSSSGGV